MNWRNLGLIKWRCQEPVVCVDLELRREVLQSIRLGNMGSCKSQELLSCFRGAESMGEWGDPRGHGCAGTDIDPWDLAIRELGDKVREVREDRILKMELP